MYANSNHGSYSNDINKQTRLKGKKSCLTKLFLAIQKLSQRGDVSSLQPGDLKIDTN